MSRHRAGRRPAADGAVHVGGGWYARRGADGSVTLLCPEGHELTVDDRHWAMLVAAVSAGGTSDATYRDALTLHGR